MSNELRQEALLNEYKGNLFEFLVAHSMAKDFELELIFLESLTADFQKMLNQQEQFIRQYYPHLLEDLPLLAIGLKDKIKNTLSNKSITKIQLMGKAALAANDKRYDEADILIFNAKGSIVPVSIKLSKHNSFVNTKSAGLKSFFTKYFNAPQKQLEFNHKADQILSHMVYALYESVDLEADEDFSNWLAQDLPSLPGQLKDEQRKIYLDSLYKLTSLIKEQLLLILDEDSQKFYNQLLPLIGQSSKHLIQATTFYQNKDQHYQLTYHEVEGALLNNDMNIEIIGESNKTAFDIKLADRILQVRIKAMNKFTSKSFKVNCAVKKI